MNTPARYRCDECGRDVAKIDRNYHGTRYCATCYARTFKRRLCPQCGEIARLPKNRPEAVCTHCELAKPCARCGRTSYAIGKITPYGPVCNACAPHFRVQEACEACGKLSRRLTRVGRFGGDDRRLCPQCARADYRTCSACGRHRLLTESADGKRLCHICLEDGETPCPSCDKPMPAGYGKTCEACYWTKTCRKRVKIDQAAFSTAVMRDAFGEFGAWLQDKVEPHKAALTIHRYLAFFLEVEHEWKTVPTYADLVTHFAAEGLRRVRLPMQWLCETQGVEPDPKARENDSERRRIQALTDTFSKGSWAARVLAGYHDQLMARCEAGHTSLRSVRLALRPAVSLLLATEAQEQRLPDQAVLDRYLLNTPGQKAAITGFVSFLQVAYSTDLIARTDVKKTREARRRKLEREIIQMMKHPEDGDEFMRRWISAGLEYFHWVKVSKQAVRSTAVSGNDSGLRLEINGNSYFLLRWDRKLPCTVDN